MPSNSGRPPAFGRVDILDPEGAEVRFVLPRLQEVTGVVVDATGQRLEMVCVSVTCRGLASHEVVSNPQGEFRVLLPPGTEAELRVAGRYATAGSSGYTLDPALTSDAVRAAAGASGIRLRARDVARDRTLRVVVVAPDDRPVSGATVAWVPRGGGEPVEAVTGAKGAARLTGLPAHEIAINLRLPASATFLPHRPSRLVPGGQEATLRCHEAVRIVGLVLAPQGGAAAGAVLVADNGEEEFATQTDAQGRFEVLIPANWESIDLAAHWRCPDGTLATCGIRARRPSDAEQTLQLRRVR
jgi:hypothetical protein